MWSQKTGLHLSKDIIEPLEVKLGECNNSQLTLPFFPFRPMTFLGTFSNLWKFGLVLLYVHRGELAY